MSARSTHISLTWKVDNTPLERANAETDKVIERAGQAEKKYSKTGEAIKKSSKSIDEHNEKTKKGASEITNLGDQADSSFKKGKKAVEDKSKSVDGLSDSAKNASKDTEELGAKAQSSYDKAQKGAESARESVDQLDDSTKKTSKSKKALGEESTKAQSSAKEGAEKTKKSLDGLDESAKKVSKSKKDLGENSAKAQDKAKDGVDKTKKSVDQLDESTKKVSKSKKSLGDDSAKAQDRTKDGVDKTKKSMDQLDESTKKVSRSKKDLEASAKQAHDTSQRESKKSKDEVSKLGKEIDLVSRSAKGIATGIMASVGFTSLTSLGVGTFKLGLNFQQELSKVEALAGASAAEMAKLESQARELGATTRFSAQEAASGMSFLGMAGYNVNQIMDSMPGLLNLAAASAMDLGSAADITSNIMSGFGISASETARVADVLAEAAANSNTNVYQMGDAMKYSAPVASALGLELEEIAAATMSFANSGIQGSMAGTAFSASLGRLAAPTDKMSKLMQETGMSFFEASGEIKPLEGIISELERATGKMTAQQRSATLTTLFGANAYKHWATLLDDGSESLRYNTQMLEQSEGAAQRMAETMDDNLSGKIKMAQSGFQELGLKIFEFVEPALESAADAVIWFTEAANKLHPAILLVTAGAAGFAIFKTVNGFINSTKGRVDSLVRSIERIGTASAISATKTSVSMATIGGAAQKASLKGSIGTGKTIKVGASTIQKAKTGAGAGAIGVGTVGATKAKTGILGTLKAKTGLLGTTKTATGVAGATSAKTGILGTLKAKPGAVVSTAKTTGASSLGSTLAKGSRIATTGLIAGRLLTMDEDETGETVGTLAGSLGGGKLGAKAGAAIGTLIAPGVGTAIGAAVGGLGGSLAGSKFGSKFGASVQEWFSAGGPSQMVSGLGEKVGSLLSDDTKEALSKGASNLKGIWDNVKDTASETLFNGGWWSGHWETTTNWARDTWAGSKNVWESAKNSANETLFNGDWWSGRWESIKTTTSETIFNGSWWMENAGFVWGYLEGSIFNGEWWQHKWGYVQELTEGTIFDSAWWGERWEATREWAKENWESAKEVWESAKELIRSTLFNAEWWQGHWESVTDWAHNTWATATEIWESAKELANETLFNGEWWRGQWDSATVWAKEKWETATEIWESAKELINETLFNGEWWGERWDATTEWAKDKWGSATEIWETAKAKANETLFDSAWWQGKWDTVAGWANDAWSGIKSTVSGWVEPFNSGRQRGNEAATAKMHYKGTQSASGNILVGEEGFEVAYHKASATARILGANGPEITHVSPGTQILNHHDSVKLMSGGLGAGEILPGFSKGTTSLERIVDKDKKDFSTQSSNNSFKEMSSSSEQIVDNSRKDFSTQVPIVVGSDNQRPIEINCNPTINITMSGSSSEQDVKQAVEEAVRKAMDDVFAKLAGMYNPKGVM